MRRLVLLLVLASLFASACAGGNRVVEDQSEPTAIARTSATAVAPTTITSAATTEAVGTTISSTTTLPERDVVTIEVRSKESWGAKEAESDLETHDVDRITVHHTARPHDDTPMDEKLQRWQNYHQSIGFGDIAYHMVIGADGMIYQGREYEYVGSTRTSYDPTGHFLPVLDGMFDEVWDSPNDDDDEPDGADDLSAEQLGSLLDLLAWASVEFGIDPAEIAGHRDYAATACPGTVVHEMLQSGEIAERVAERIAASDFELVYVDA